MTNIQDNPAFNIALVHDWLPDFAGGELVLEQFVREFEPDDIYTLFSLLSASETARLAPAKIHTSRLQRLPFLKKYYRLLIEDCMLAIERFDLSSYDVVLSSSVAFGKGVLTGPSQLHIAYIHSPPRYAWDLMHEYFFKKGIFAPIINEVLLRKFHKLRLWDLRTINAIDRLIVNSHFVGSRVQKLYRRDFDVIYPPVDIDAFTLALEKDDYYVTASRLVPYKRVDVIVEAFTRMPNKKLVVIGNGPEQKRLKAVAGPNIEFLGHVSRERLIASLQKARAYVYAGLEDFGIAPVEAQACGTPVIGYGAGGLLETVRDIHKESPTGIHFPQQNATSLIEAVTYFEANRSKVNSETIRRHAENFSAERFRREMRNFLDQSWAAHCKI